MCMQTYHVQFWRELIVVCCNTSSLSVPFTPCGA
jgi:hypothetical protein